MLADAVWYLKGQGQPAVDALRRLPETDRGRENYGLWAGNTWLPGPGGVARYVEGRLVECICLMRKVPGFTRVIDFLSLDSEIGTININKLMLLHIQDNHNVYGYFREGIAEKLADTKHAQDEKHAKENGEAEQLLGYQMREGMAALTLAVGQSKISPADAFALVEQAQANHGPIPGYSPDALPPMPPRPVEPWSIADIEAHFAAMMKGVRRG